MLRALVNKYGPKKWAQIAEELGSDKGPKQCRRRWKNRLSADFVSTEWTPEEDRTLLTMQAEIGNKWTEIARKLPGRTVCRTLPGLLFLLPVLSLSRCLGFRAARFPAGQCGQEPLHRSAEAKRQAGQGQACPVRAPEEGRCRRGR